MLMSTLCYYAQVITVYDDPAEEQLTLSSRERPVEVHVHIIYNVMYIVYMYVHVCTCKCQHCNSRKSLYLLPP